MKSPLSSPPFKLPRIASAAIFVVFVGCADKADEIASFQDAPFYYYDGKRIPLKVTPYMTFRIPDGAGAEVAQQVAKSAGTSGIPRRLLSAEGHWVVDLSRGIRTAGNVVAAARENSLVIFASIAYTDTAREDSVFLLDRVIVRFKDSTSPSQIEILAASLRLGLERRPQPDSGIFEYHFRYPKSVGPGGALEVAATLSEHPLVAWADPDKISNRRLAKVPPDPFYSWQFYLSNQIRLRGIPVDINVEPAWDRTSGRRTRIAVIDDGVEALHEDLVGRVTTGYDAWTGATDGRCADGATSPFGNDSHGTSVAGIIGARHNTRGIAGIAPEAEIVPVRIFRRGVSVSDAYVAIAINYAWSSARADVISNSWGDGTPSNAILHAIMQADSLGRGGKGALVVFAAGNSSDRSQSRIGEVVWPATLPSVLAVGAINPAGALTNYTPEGTELDIVSVSSDTGGTCIGGLATTDLMGPPGCNDGPGGSLNYTRNFSGTSATAPQVAAVGLLVYSLWPNLTATQVAEWILCTTDSWGDAKMFGRGKLNAGRAVVSALPPSCAQPRSSYGRR